MIRTAWVTLSPARHPHSDIWAQRGRGHSRSLVGRVLVTEYVVGGACVGNGLLSLSGRGGKLGLLIYVR